MVPVWSPRWLVASTALLMAGLATGTAAVASPSVASPPAAARPATPALGADALAVRSADSLVASRPSYLHIGPDDAVRQGRIATFGGIRYVPYERTYRGLPVIGGDFVLVVDAAGQVTSASVAQKLTISGLSVTPKQTKEAAERAAARQLGTVSRIEDTHLAVYALGAAPRLAWESTVDGTNAEGPSRLTVVVDAATGAVLRTQEHVMHGSGTAAYNGPNPLYIATLSVFGVFYNLTDPVTLRLGCEDATGNTSFMNTTNHWGNGDATNKETACVDALFAAQTQVKMLSQWLGRNAMDGVGGAWPIRVGLDARNAFYDGTQVKIGHNTANQWISSLDVVGHEMGHGIDDHTPGGISGGGTQEFIADAFATATEWFANEAPAFDPPDFQIGEEVNLLGTGPIRTMYNPSLVGHPNCFSSSIPNEGVHSAAGPGDHWFYLLAEGTNPTDGQPTSPTCNNTTLTGIGIVKAIQILYNAMLMKTTASSYLTYRSWTLTAARNLFPGRCDEYNAVKAAWEAVSVPAQAGELSCFNLPDVLTMRQANAAAAINSVGLSVGVVSQDHRCLDVAGRVVEQTPQAGVRFLLPGAPVNLKVASATNANGRPCVIQ